ncbi:MAG: regulatory protein RecX [Bacteroidetes bacterium]|nr:regulatory protein RecX [Bacteroidota bacterium]
MNKPGTDDSLKDDLEAILARIQNYCAYQERCIKEVDNKLMLWKVSEAKIKKIKLQLTKEGFINEERYARLFVRSKFHVNKWGRTKIRYELKTRTIPENLVQKAMEEIGEDDYLSTIRELILKKMSEIKTSKHLNIRQKIITFVTGKGFEFDLILKVLTELKI